MSEYMLLRRQRMLGIAPPELPKEHKPIKKVSDKKKKEIAANAPKKAELDKWFAERIKEMKGLCAECGAKINKANPKFARCSVAHVLPKRNNMFPSVATNKYNWIELCVLNGCHAKYDRSWGDATGMKIWGAVVEKFKLIYPHIAANERKHLPDVLRQEVL